MKRFTTLMIVVVGLLSSLALAEGPSSPVSKGKAVDSSPIVPAMTLEYSPMSKPVAKKAVASNQFIPVVDFKLTLSGHKYTLAEKGFGPWPTKVNGISYDYGLVAGADIDTKNPVGGGGIWIVWADSKSPLEAKAGLFGIAQSNKPTDFSIGLSLGTRF